MKIAFYRGKGSVFDWIVRLVTRGPYSHCELVFSGGMTFSAFPWETTKFKFKLRDPREWDFVDVPMLDVKEALVEKFCIDEKGCKYDYPGVFRFLLPFLKQSPTRWFCSEICCAALQRVDYTSGIHWSVKPWRVHPNRLYRLLTERGN